MSLGGEMAILLFLFMSVFFNSRRNISKFLQHHVSNVFSSYKTLLTFQLESNFT